MRFVSIRVRARRAAEPSEPESEEATEPVHHEHSISEHQEHEHEHHHTQHHPSHDYNHIKDKFMNELNHLPSKPFIEFASAWSRESHNLVVEINCLSLVIIWKKKSTLVKFYKSYFRIFSLV